MQKVQIIQKQFVSCLSSKSLLEQSDPIGYMENFFYSRLANQLLFYSIPGAEALVQDLCFVSAAPPHSAVFFSEILSPPAQQFTSIEFFFLRLRFKVSFALRIIPSLTSSYFDRSFPGGPWDIDLYYVLFF